MKSLRARTGLRMLSCIVLAHFVAAPERQTNADGITGNVVFAGDSLSAGDGAAPQGSFSAQCLTILGPGWKGHNSSAAGRTRARLWRTTSP